MARLTTTAHAGAGLAAVWTSASLMQLSAQGGSLFERFRQMSIQAETDGLAEPFKGVTTHGTPRPGLFTVKATGVSTAAVQRAADAFLRSLSDTQRYRTTFAVEDRGLAMMTSLDTSGRRTSGI